jgi:UDP-N-acetylglucosamine 2-epimerase (non-hydrolysing)
MRENQTLSEVQARILTSLDKVYTENKVDATIVQGDTMTVLCGALASFYRKIPVFHVEAGLRSYDIFEPFPEEVMRQMTSRVADLHFAPTEKNKKALLKEDIAESKVHVTGNTVIDALFCLSDSTIEQAKSFFVENDIDVDDKLVLITVHRRENHGERIDRILDAIEFLVKTYADHKFVIPVHPNPNVKCKIHTRLAEYDNVHLLKPLDYPYLVYLMKNAKLILTDSGGIQEEAPGLGKPVLVMRDTTERPEALESGTVHLVGTDYDKIMNEVSTLLEDAEAYAKMSQAVNPYGDGLACGRIVDALK